MFSEKVVYKNAIKFSHDIYTYVCVRNVFQEWYQICISSLHFWAIFESMYCVFQISDIPLFLDINQLVYLILTTMIIRLIK